MATGLEQLRGQSNGAIIDATNDPIIITPNMKYGQSSGNSGNSDVSGETKSKEDLINALLSSDNTKVSEITDDQRKAILSNLLDYASGPKPQQQTDQVDINALRTSDPLFDAGIKKLQKTQDNHIEEAVASGVDSKSILNNLIDQAKNRGALGGGIPAPFDINQIQQPGVNQAPVIEKKPIILPQESPSQSTKPLTNAQGQPLTDLQKKALDLVNNTHPHSKGIIGSILSPIFGNPGDVAEKNQQLQGLGAAQEILGERPLQAGDRDKANMDFTNNFIKSIAEKSGGLDQKNVDKINSGLTIMKDLDQVEKLYSDTVGKGGNIFTGIGTDIGKFFGGYQNIKTYDDFVNAYATRLGKFLGEDKFTDNDRKVFKQVFPNQYTNGDQVRTKFALIRSAVASLVNSAAAGKKESFASKGLDLLSKVNKAREAGYSEQEIQDKLLQIAR